MPRCTDKMHLRPIVKLLPPRSAIHMYGVDESRLHEQSFAHLLEPGLYQSLWIRDIPFCCFTIANFPPFPVIEYWQSGWIQPSCPYLKEHEGYNNRSQDKTPRSRVKVKPLVDSHFSTSCIGFNRLLHMCC